MKDLLRALKYFRPDASRVAGVFGLMLVNVTLNVLKPWPVAVLMDSVLGNKPWPGQHQPLPEGAKSMLVVKLSVAVLFLYLAQAAFSAFQNYFSVQIGLRGAARLREELFARLLRSSPRSHQGATAGDLIYRATTDSYSVQTLFQGLITCVTAFVSLVVMACIMAWLNPPLALVALALAPMLVIALRYCGPAIFSRAARAQEADGSLASLGQQVRTREEIEAGRLRAEPDEAQRRRLAQHGSELVCGFVVAMIFGIAMAVMTWLGARQVLIARLTVGQLFVFLSYLVLLYEPLSQLSLMGASAAGVRRVFEMLDTPDEAQS